MNDSPVYRLIFPDPPWPETGGGGRGAQNHYTVVPYTRIPEVVLGAPEYRPDEAFWLLVWSTSNSLPHALKLIEAAGCRYITKWTWVKTTKGSTPEQMKMKWSTGQYGLHATEDVLLAKRGVIGRDAEAAKKAKAVWAGPPGAHSEKPDFFYEQARALFEGPRLEMFANKEREGFDSHGWGH